MSNSVDGAESFMAWTLAGVGSMVATMAATIATLWKVNEARNNKMIEQLTADVSECKQDREQLRNRCDQMSDELAALKVRQAFLEQEQKRNG